MPMPLVPPVIKDESVLARYPFLPQGREYIRNQLSGNGIDVKGLIEEPWLEDVRTKGSLRLVEAVTHKEGIDAATTLDLSSELGRMTETLSYLHAMLIVCASFEDRLLNRWVEERMVKEHLLILMEISM